MQKFDTPAPITAVLDIPAGRVRFIAADRADTTVEVLPADASKGRDVKAAEQTKVEYGDGVLRIEAPGEEPALRPLRIHRGDGPAARRFPGRGQGRRRRVPGRRTARRRRPSRARTARSSSTRPRASASPPSPATSWIGRLGGPAEISTTKGDIRIAEAVGGTVVLRTQAGDISVGAAAGVSASLDAGTTYGRISNALKNDGTAELDIRATTSYGDITARSL